MWNFKNTILLNLVIRDLLVRLSYRLCCCTSPYSKWQNVCQWKHFGVLGNLHSFVILQPKDADDKIWPEKNTQKYSRKLATDSTTISMPSEKHFSNGNYSDIMFKNIGEDQALYKKT